MTSVSREAPPAQVASLWAKTSGSVEERAQQLATALHYQGVDGVASDRIIRDVRAGRFDKVAAMFADAPVSSTRAHDKARDGMRSGSASTHQTSLSDWKPAISKPTASTQYAFDPPALSAFDLYAYPGFFTDEQRTWIRDGGPRSASPCGLRSVSMLESATRNLQAVINSLSSSKRNPAETPALARMLRCACENMSEPETHTMLERTVTTGLNSNLALRRAITQADALRISGWELANPGAIALPTRAWNALASELSLAPVLRPIIQDAVTAGRLDVAAGVARVLARSGLRGPDARTLAVASLIDTGAYASAADRLSRSVEKGSALDCLASDLRVGSHVSAATMKLLVRDEHDDVVAALERRGIADVDGLTLSLPKAVSFNELIAAGRARLSPELFAAVAGLRVANADMRASSPPTRAASDRVRMLEKEVADAMGRLQDPSTVPASDFVAYDLAAHGIAKSATVRILSPDLHRHLRDGLTWTRGNGLALVDEVVRSQEANGENSFHSALESRIGLDDFTRDSRASLFHELGHALESSHPELAAACIAWRDQRGRGVSDLRAQGYSDGKAVSGDFVTPYVGKIISDRATEVMSVGFEHFASPTQMGRLCAADEEHFCLVLGWLAR